MYTETVILANGDYPSHYVPLGYLKNSTRIVCCDGAVKPLLEAGLEPYAVVGDCDSLDEKTVEGYSDRIFRIPEQDTNDLTKAVKWCTERGFKDLVILGATGKREDHTLGNISLLADYIKIAKVLMISDYGTFRAVTAGSTFKCIAGQQVSLFSIDPETEITSGGLRYPLKNMKLSSWWQATLNETTGNSFSLLLNGGGPVIVFFSHC
ncbi:MAG TPA: thiamine diphosphokinase [Bacteroidales bacterium]|nr:thiamine diphosphokinase [Bacteroidales bacterium]